MQRYKNMSASRNIHGRLLPFLFTTVLATVLAAGCASTPAPVDKVASASEAITRAANAGGNEYAPMEMQSARDRMARAQIAMTAKEFGTARTLSQEVLVDTQLAETKVRAAKAQQASGELREGRRVLEGEIQRNKP